MKRPIDRSNIKGKTGSVACGYHRRKLSAPGAQSCRRGGHYAVTVVSSKFENTNLIDQRRLVYSALDDQINGSPKVIHALQIKTLTPAQWAEQTGQTV